MASNLGGTRRKTVSHDEAEALAISALGFLAEDAQRLDRFLALSGLTPETLRQAAAAPGFLAAVLDHIGGDERLLLAFAAAQPCDPSRIPEARALL